MKILFINPVMDPHVNPGLAYVMTCVGRHHLVRMLDFVYHYRNYREYIESEVGFEPDIVAAGVNSLTFAYAKRVIAILKKKYPRIKTLVGGAQPTLLPEETIADPLIDAICIGEGEFAAVEYLDKIEGGVDPTTAGIWHKDRAGRVIKGNLRPFYQDIDSLPFPDWDYYDIETYFRSSMHLYRGLIHLISRGCPYSCTYCSEAAIRSKIPGKYYRVRSPENIIAEVKHNLGRYESRGMKGVALFSLTFGVDEEWVSSFCEQYRQAGLHLRLPWCFQTRIDLMTERKVRMIAEAGCALVAFGIESGDEQIRNTIFKKHFDLAQIERATSLLREHNILWSTNLIVGAPGETRASLSHSLELVRRLKPDKIYYFFYQPLPLTELSNFRKQMEFDDGIGFWNIPRRGTGELSLAELKRIKQRIFAGEISRVLKKGWSLRGFLAFYDFITFILDRGEKRLFPLKHPYSLLDLAQSRIDKHLFAKQRRIFFERFVK